MSGPRLIHRPRLDGRPDRRKSSARTDCRDLLTVGGPMVLVWDIEPIWPRVSRNSSPPRGWLTVYQLPSCAPDLNTVEGICSLLRRGWISIVAFITTPEHLIRTFRHDLRKIHYRSDLIDGCLAGALTRTHAAD